MNSAMLYSYLKLFQNYIIDYVKAFNSRLYIYVYRLESQPSVSVFGDVRSAYVVPALVHVPSGAVSLLGVVAPLLPSGIIV